VHEAIEDGVGQRGIAEVLMPVGDRELAGDLGRAGVEAIIEDFEQVPALLVVQRCQTPVIEDEQISFGQLDKELGVTPVGAGEA
jgi:hypothetical protein